MWRSSGGGGHRRSLRAWVRRQFENPTTAQLWGVAIGGFALVAAVVSIAGVMEWPWVGLFGGLLILALTAYSILALSGLGSTVPSAVAHVVDSRPSWLVPGQHATEVLSIEGPPIRGSRASGSIAHSVDGSILAQLVDDVLSVFTTSDQRVECYGLWRTMPLDKAWKDGKVVAVGRRGYKGVWCAIDFEIEVEGRFVRKLARFWLAKEGSANELDDRAVNADSCVFLGSTLLIASTQGDGKVREWLRVSEDDSELSDWGEDTVLSLEVRWIDAVLHRGTVVVGVLGRAKRRADVVRLVLCTSDGSRRMDGLTLTRPYQQLVIARNCRGGSELLVALRDGRRVDWVSPTQPEPLLARVSLRRRLLSRLPGVGTQIADTSSGTP